MLSIKKIREDLRDIRYYYSKQKMFDAAAKTVVQSSVLNKVDMYNQAVKDAPARLYDLYVSLYVNNNTQDGLAHVWHYSPDYIKQLNKQLCEYLLGALGGKPVLH
jgi:hypothetical protein